MRRILPLLAALMLAACGKAAPAPAPSDEAIAAFAGADTQFNAILAQLVFSTQSLPMAAYALGIPESCAVVRPAFEAAVAHNLPAWRANLAKAYRDTVPAATLAEAVAAGAGGKAAVTPYLDKIGASMKAASMPLLEQAANEVITPAVNAATKVDIKAVDGAARMQQMKAAQADGSLFCGLLAARGAGT